MAGASFGVVDNAMKSITPVEEYIRVGMDMANNVVADFMEKPNEDSDSQIEDVRNVMLEFIKMERDLNQFREAVNYVKEQASTTADQLNMEAVLDEKLSVLKGGNNDAGLLQHEMLLEFNQKVWESLHPDEPYAGQAGASSSHDDDIEMSQAIVTRCPYTGKEMVVPMKNKICGHNYEQAAILEYIKKRKRKAKCPLGGCLNEKPLELTDLIENKELKRHIDRKNRQTTKKH